MRYWYVILSVNIVIFIELFGTSRHAQDAEGAAGAGARGP